MVSDEAFLEAFLRVKKLADELLEAGDYHPTYFEFLFLMGMVIFQKENVDYIILETGLGGRLDATNAVLNPIACVITSISLDHVEYLAAAITNIDRKARSIQLSIRAKDQAETREAMAKMEEDAQAGTTNLGALLRAKLEQNK